MRVVGADNKIKPKGQEVKNHFDNRTLNRDLNDAIDKANEMLVYNSPMMLELLSKDDFKYNSGLGFTVHEKIVGFNKTVPVFFYKPFNPWSAAMGYSDGKSIYINSRKFPSMVFSDVVGLLLHELMHQVGFNHGNNYKTEDKCLYSVPYFVSENVGKWV
jgi:hypothetical protein